MQVPHSYLCPPESRELSREALVGTQFLLAGICVSPWYVTRYCIKKQVWGGLSIRNCTSKLKPDFPQRMNVADLQNVLSESKSAIALRSAKLLLCCSFSFLLDWCFYRISTPAVFSLHLPSPCFVGGGVAPLPGWISRSIVLLACRLSLVHDCGLQKCLLQHTRGLGEEWPRESVEV